MADQEKQEILSSLAVLGEKIDTLLRQSGDHEIRLRCLEQRGSKKWDTTMTAIITTIVGLVIGLIASKI